MSTCNFWTMKNFPLMVMGNYDACKWVLGDEDENGIPYEDYSNEDIWEAWDVLDYEFEHDELHQERDILNDSLKWYCVTLRSGYYEGVQFYVETNYTDFDAKIPTMGLAWDDESCLDEFGLNRGETRQMIAEEERKINEFLQSTTDYGFRELICGGVFSNGEAVYYYKDELEKRAKGEG